MGLSIYNLFKAALLVVNAMAVLHPQRFLKAYGLHGGGAQGALGPLGGAEDASAVKAQVGGLLTATRYLRWPLIFVNVLIVVVELIFG